jgi:hypothetical protein
MGMLGSLLFDQKVNHTVDDAPADEIQLGYRSDNILVINVECDALRPAKWIKQLFRVTIETRLVRDVHSKRTSRMSCIREVMFLGVVGHKIL